MVKFGFLISVVALVFLGYYISRFEGRESMTVEVLVAFLSLMLGILLILIGAVNAALRTVTGWFRTKDAVETVSGIDRTIGPTAQISPQRKQEPQITRSTVTSSAPKINKQDSFNISQRKFHSKPVVGKVLDSHAILSFHNEQLLQKAISQFNGEVGKSASDPAIIKPEEKCLVNTESEQGQDDPDDANDSSDDAEEFFTFE